MIVLGKWDAYRPVVLCWGAQCSENCLELIHVGLSGQVRRAEHQLGEDAPD